jgi:hypothetical protein
MQCGSTSAKAAARPCIGQCEAGGKLKGDIMIVKTLHVDYQSLTLTVEFESLQEMRDTADRILNDRVFIPPPEMDAQIVRFMCNGSKIEAIRYHRGLTHASLYDSKAYVEKVAVEAGL